MKIKSLPFLIKGENYLLKMKTDQQFLQNSVFSRLFNFSAKSDPLLVVPSIVKSEDKQIVVIESGLAKRIKKATTTVLSERNIAEDESTQSLISPQNIIVY